MSADQKTAAAQTVAGLHRFGFGARPGDLARIGADVRGLLLAEVAEKRVAAIKDVPFPTSMEAGPALRAFTDGEQRARQARRMEAPAVAPSLNAMGREAMPAPLPAEQPLPGRVYREEARARFHAALEPLGGFSERLVAFWSNHFAVSVAKGNPVRTFAGLMEREAIRPHLYGRFTDMLIAVESHPAMVVYLDNQQSIGPNSRGGARRGRGLNENLAREILELHTLGVNGGYTQGDVTSLAKIITGWTLVGGDFHNGPPGTFFYNGWLHEPGEHSVLGKTYPDWGFGQGAAALADIARHPSTAQHVARKLAAHFVADVPPPALVTRLAKVFRETEGDLQKLSLALLDAPESWAAPAGKMRSPYEFLVASARALGRKPEAGQILQPLNAMGQPFWQPPGPNGFPDTAAALAAPEGVKTRLDVAAAIARQVGGGVDPRQLLDEIMGEAVSRETRQAVARAETRAQGLALALMSPEFQRR